VPDLIADAVLIGVAFAFLALVVWFVLEQLSHLRRRKWVKVLDLDEVKICWANPKQREGMVDLTYRLGWFRRKSVMVPLEEFDLSRPIVVLNGRTAYLDTKNVKLTGPDMATLKRMFHVKLGQDLIRKQSTWESVLLGLALGLMLGSLVILIWMMYSPPPFLIHTVYVNATATNVTTIPIVPNP
jgi:hypothetical protein